VLPDVDFHPPFPSSVPSVFVLNGLVAAGPITHMALMAESPPVIHHLIGALVLFCCFAFPF
jgi:hypothetical protein